MPLDERYGGCSRGRPLVVLLGGVASSEGLPGLAFTPDFPCGMTTDATGLVRTPLVRIAVWGGCLGDPECSPNALVRASAAADDRTVIGQTSVSAPDTCQGRTSEMRVKLEITPCGWKHSIVIDSDSRVVVPSGPATIHVLAPLGFAMGSQIVVGTQPWTDVALRVQGCETSCCEVDGSLTEWLYVEPGYTVAQRTVIRPRGAHTLQVSAITPGGAVSNVVVLLGQHGVGTAPPLGAHTMQAGFPLALIPIGAAEYIELAPPAEATVMLRWGIR